LLPLFTSKKNKLHFAVGLGGSPFFIRDYKSSMTRNSLPILVMEAGIVFYVIPRINYHINEKFFLDLNIPINLAQTAFQKVRVENPSMPIAEQTNNRFNFNLFSNVLAARIGVGMKL